MAQHEQSVDTEPPERSRQQKLAEAALAPHPHRLELRGAVESLAWPAICAYCGSDAPERLRVQKAFRRHRGFTHHRHSSLFDYQIVSADVPFCTACVELHRQTLPRVSPFTRWRTFFFNPAHIATVGCAFLLWKIGPSARDVASATGAEWQLGWSLIGLLAFGVIWTPGIIWWMTRPDRLEPRTDVTRACDFSGNVAMPFERARHIFSLRNESFAAALAAVNRGRVWTAGDQSRSWNRSAVFAAVCLSILLAARLLLWIYTGK